MAAAAAGCAVAPFKAQNMSNNSVVTADGGEIGRAQAMQAHACGLAPSVAFNPVLLKPGSDRSAQVVVRGRVDGTVSARSYQERKAALLDVVTASLADLRARFDVVVCEGAGSPAEINLRANDIANMGLAQAADLPVVVVGDIDRGGVLAHLFGTVAVLDPADQRAHRGLRRSTSSAATRRCSGPASTSSTPSPAVRRTGCCRGPNGLWLDAEDSLSAVADGVLGRPAPPHGSQWLRVAVVRLPRISNATDAEALACEPGVAVRYVTEPSRLADADLVVLPGTRATVADLAWLRRTGLADAVRAHAAAGRPVLGICGGYQMLGRRIADPHGVEGGDATGLGLLDLEIVFDAEKHLANPVGTAWGEPVRGYEIHHGRVARSGDPPLDRRRGLGQRRRARHPLARPAGERRLPPGAAPTGGRAGRPGRASRSRRTPRSPRSGRPSSTCSATSSRRTSTPPRWNMSSITVPPADLPVITSGLAVSR